jgi:hypothetical protein
MVATDDLQKYLTEGGNAFKVDRHWQQVLAILTSGSGKGVTRRLRDVRIHISADEPRSHP